MEFGHQDRINVGEVTRGGNGDDAERHPAYHGGPAGQREIRD